jgi:hypothetical protein
MPLGLPMLAVLLACSACASDPPPAPPLAQISPPDPDLIARVKAERETASRTYVLCLAAAAKRLDDHRSDPASIARGMLSACATEFDADVRAHSQNLDLQGQQQVANQLRETSLDSAIQLVLKNRQATQHR